MRQDMHLEIIFSSSCKYILGLEGKFNGTRRDERFINVIKLTRLDLLRFNYIMQFIL